MASNRRERQIKERAKRKAQKEFGMRAPGDKSRYAKKKAGEIRPEYRCEGGLILSADYLRVLEMPGPHVVTYQEYV